MDEISVSDINSYVADALRVPFTSLVEENEITELKFVLIDPFADLRLLARCARELNRERVLEYF